MMDVGKIEQKVEAVMNAGLSCTEAMLHVFNTELALGLDDKALRMASGFSGGSGRQAAYLRGAYRGPLWSSGR